MKCRSLSIVLFLLVLPWFASCASTIPLRTPSGTPEVLLRGADQEMAMTAVVEELASVGYQQGWTDGRTAVFHRKLEDFQMSVLSGAKWGSEMDLRVTCQLQPRPSGFLAVASIEVVGNPGTADESIKDVSEATEFAREVQDCFEMAVGSVALRRHALNIDRRENEERETPPIWTGQ